MSKVIIPVSIDLGASLERIKAIETFLLKLVPASNQTVNKFKELKDVINKVDSGALGKVPDVFKQIVPPANEVVKALERFAASSKFVSALDQAVADATASVLQFAQGSASIEDLLPVLARLTQEAGGLEEGLSLLKDLPGFDEFTQGLGEGLDLLERFGDKATDINFDPNKTLSTRLKEARANLELVVAEFGASSVEADNAAEAVNKLNDELKLSKQLAAGVDVAGKFELAGRALAGVASAFQTVTALQAVFGGESKKTEEALKKVQAVMALTQGIEGVINGAKAFKALGVSAIGALKGIKTGIAATGIGLLVVSLGLVVAYWDDIKKAISGTSKEQKLLNDYTKDAVDIRKQAASSAAEEISKLKILYDISQNQNVSLKERNRAVDQLQKIYPSYFANLSNEAILAGNAKGAYDNLTKSIIAKARAEAGQKKIAEIFEDEDYQDALTKVNNVNKKLETARKFGISAGEAISLNLGPLSNFKPGTKEFEKAFSLYETKLKEVNKESISTVENFDKRAASIISVYGADNLLDAVIGDPTKAAAKGKEAISAVEQIARDLASALQDADIAELLGLGSQTEERLKAFQEAAKQYLKLGFSIDSPTLQKVLSEISILKIQLKAEELRASVKVVLDETSLTNRQKIEEKLATNFQGELKFPVFVRPVITPRPPEGSEYLENYRQTILDDQAAFQEKYTALVESGLEDALEALGTAIGEGEDPFAALSKSIGNSLANFVTSLGKDMVKLGTLFKILSEALNKLKPPGLKVAVGLALIAFGAAIRSSINKKSENKFARGGFVDGPGTDTSDSIPARLSKGEYVIKAKSVRKYGARVMEKINKGQVPVASLARATSQENNEFFENIISRGRNGGSTTALVNRSSNELGEALKQFTRNGGTSKALVNRFEAPLLFSNGGYVDDFYENIISRGRSGGTTKALVNRFEVPQFFSDGGLVEATRQFGRKGGSAKVLVNRFEMPTLPNVNMTETFQREVPYIATTKVSGQDLKIILERADRRYSNAT